LLTAPASAQIISDSVLLGFFQPGGPTVETTGTVNTTLNYTDPFTGFAFSADYQGEITTNGIRLYHWSKFSTTSELRAGVQDTYTVTTDNPGEELVFNAVLRANGNSETVFNPNPVGNYAANVRVRMGAGGDLLNAEPFNGSPAIDASFGKVSGDFGIINNGSSIFGTTYDFASVDFDHQLVIPLRVTAGEPFPLAISVVIRHSLAAETNMLDTAVLTFELPAGATISSVKGFGTTEPAPPCPDATGDGLVGTADLLVLLANWGQSVAGGASDGDFDGSGTVGTADLLELLAGWGTACP
jgi:hypothetical protein